MNVNTSYDWPDYYDWTSNGLDHDTTYYTELAKASGGPVLELGCGTGRVTVAIAREGFPIIGIDNSHEMLLRAEQKAQSLGVSSNVQFIEEEMQDFELPDSRFPLAIIPYRSFMHVTHVEEQIKTLENIYRHLTDDGVLAFNVFVPFMDQLVEMDGKRQFRGTFPVPGTEDEIELYDFTEIEPFHQLINITRYMERFDHTGKSLERIRTMLEIRYSFPTELFHLLKSCGFRVTQTYGTFYRNPFSHQSEELIIEARKV
ncbi:ubiquinone/menaquinone biosynthesis C-methylase UbiE [Croceifilum oryzae]|uniref:Ubiquinone/menaquinone biosynthesis C-methylase UbiE n=1 Tax=Croceifilum oryzae TaxID=1553429 RepID=A0AAJ1TMH3_9BACL|nr:class I SAM-dependent methyltransferase [Croceifilum oryzae]MDQ0418924.1 ubiquinone/menaquinone biosynthesis C-methylase UbiE [Croceifilum oryzae]